MAFDVDLLVIGAGSAGVRAARTAAGFGAKVLICEDRQMGGTCVNVGCVPKKLLVYASAVNEALEDAAGFGWTIGERSFSWPALIAAKDKEIARLNGVYARLLERAGVEIVRGRGRVVGPHAVAVAGRTITAEHILIATGGRPHEPPFPGVELAVTSDDMFHLPELPRRVLVKGAGYIGVEFACILHNLGVKVCVVHRGEGVLAGFDHDVAQHLTEELERKGIDFRFSTAVVGISRQGDGFVVDLSDGTELEADLVLCATGRRPNTAGLGLEDVGVTLSDAGGVVVDHRFRSSVPSILAVGDVIDRLQLTPVALAEGMAVAHDLFGPGERPVRYEDIPTAVFSQPALATVGLTEQEARQRGHDVVIFRSAFRPMRGTLSGREERTLMKLVVDRQSDRVLGVHVCGPEAAEIVQGFAVALNCGATKAQLDGTIGIHPTAAEELVTMRTPVPDSLHGRA